MVGLASHRATTTVEVVDRPELNRETYLQLIADGLAMQNYLASGPLEAGLQEWLVRAVEELIDLAAPLYPGTILERRGDCVTVRCGPAGSSY